MRSLVVPAVLMVALAGCGGDEAPQREAAGAVEARTSFAPAAERAVQAVEAGRAEVLDVRTDGERAAGHAEGSEHLPLAAIEAGEVPGVAKDAKLFVYCRTGRRAAEAVKLLRDAGYEDVTNIGGLADWDRAGGARAG